MELISNSLGILVYEYSNYCKECEKVKKKPLSFWKYILSAFSNKMYRN